MHIGFTLQNVGDVDLGREVGDAVPILETLRRLEARGHRITCLRLAGASVERLDSFAASLEPRPAALGMTGSPVFRFFEGAWRRLQRGLGVPYVAAVDSLRFSEACIRELAEVDLFHEHAGLFSLGTARAARRLGRPHVLTVSGDPIRERRLQGRRMGRLRGSLARSATRSLYGSADAILTVSDAGRDRLVETWCVPSEKVHVVQNGVDLADFPESVDGAALRRRLDLGDGPVVGFVGGFRAWHGLGDLVASFEIVARQIPEARLLLVGDGPERAAVQRDVEARDLTSRTCFPGLVPRGDLPLYLAVMTVAVLPYSDLGDDMWFSPLKLFEYAAAGRAIVATDQGQARQILDHGRTGWLVPPGAVEELGAAIVRLASDGELARRLGTQARILAGRHSWEATVDRVEQVYAAVTRGRRRS